MWVHIFIPGGAGYVGSKLVLALLQKGYKVTVLDLFLYGEEVFSSCKEHPNLSLVKGDIREEALVDKALQGVDAVIHLACISNDPSFELNPSLGKSINLDSFEPFVLLAKKHKVRRFIYASSSSVYGVKKEKDVQEEVSLEPLTDYSKFKAECETLLFRHLSQDFEAVILRPATVCGVSSRQRLDLIVNILTNHAFHRKKIKVLGGPQLRPNIHIEDMVRAYIHVLQSPREKIQGEIFNVGYENHSVLDLAKMVQQKVGPEVEIEQVETEDLRSYHISSKKIGKKLGFFPEFTIGQAVEDLTRAFEKRVFPKSLENSIYFNVERMKEVQLI